jgi:hypothetical protein
VNKRLKIVGEELSEPEGWVGRLALIGGHNMYSIDPSWQIVFLVCGGWRGVIDSVSVMADQRLNVALRLCEISTWGTRVPDFYL